ncbi:MAG: hypothetical protein E7665_01445 [Ruminococcaceae bacterium]|nr:hypothetical protein [Oscillospiraceae bacterium]
MKLIWYEIQKIINKQVLIIIAVSLLLNVCIAYLSTENASIDGNAVAEYYEGFQKDPSKADEVWQRLEQMPESVDKNEQYALERYEAQREYSQRYEKDLNMTIFRAKINLKEYEAKNRGNEYISKYQIQVIDEYTRMKELGTDDGLVLGWDDHLLYAEGVYILMVLIVIASVRIFLVDRECAFYPIVRSSKKGRLATVASKTAAVFVSSVIFSFLISGTSLLTAWTLTGLHGGELALTSIEAYEFCSFDISIASYAFIQFVFRSVFSFILGIICGVLAMAIRETILTLGSGVLLIAANVLISSFTYTGNNNIIKLCNLYSLIQCDPIFISYHSVNIFGAAVPLIIFDIALIILLSTGLFFALLKLWRIYPAAGRHIQFMKKLLGKFSRRVIDEKEIKGRKKHKIRKLSVRIAFHEINKFFVTYRYTFVVLVLIALKAGFSYFYAEYEYRYDDIYKDYMNDLEGVQTQEKQRFIREEEARVQYAVAMKDSISKKFKNDEITYEEYVEQMEGFWDAKAREPYVGRLKTHSDYLNRKKAEGGDPWYVYDTGWNRLFSMEADIILLAAIIIICGKLFVTEHTSKFYMLMRSTKYGRKYTAVRKISLALGLTVFVTVLFSAIDLMFVLWKYELPMKGFPLNSLEMFESVSSGITIEQYLILSYIMRIAASCFICLFCSVAAHMVKNPIAAMTVPAVFFGAFYIGGMYSDIVFAFDTFSVLGAHKYALFSSSTDILGDTGICIIALAVIPILTVVITRSLIKKYERT